MKTKAKPIAAILTDTHLKPSNINVNIQVYFQALDIVHKLGLSRLHHGGDIFESRKGQPQDVLLAFKFILDKAQHDYGIKIIAIPGNHDKTDYASKESFLDPFSTHPSLTLFRECAGLSLYPEGSGIWMHYMPFFSDEKYLEEFKPVLTKGKNILLTHIGMDGARMNNGTIIQSKITKELFKGFDKVMIGHYHDSDNDMYIGSSIQHNFGETAEKGLTILYDDLHHETIPLDFPKFLKFEVDVKDMTLKDINDFKAEKEKTGNQYRIVLTGDTAKIKAYDKHALQEAGISVAVKDEEITEEEIETRISPFTDATLIQSFQSFCEKNNLTYETGLKYINKALKITQ